MALNNLQWLMCHKTKPNHVPWSFKWHAIPFQKWFGGFTCFLQAVIFICFIWTALYKSFSFIALLSEDSWFISKYHFHLIVHTPWWFPFIPTLTLYSSVLVLVLFLFVGWLVGLICCMSFLSVHFLLICHKHWLLFRPICFVFAFILFCFCFGLVLFTYLFIYLFKKSGHWPTE